LAATSIQVPLLRSDRRDTDFALFVALRDAEGTGRPLGSNQFVAELERLTDRQPAG
jgi:hypothetical protein